MMELLKEEAEAKMDCTMKIVPPQLPEQLQEEEETVGPDYGAIKYETSEVLEEEEKAHSQRQRLTYNPHRSLTSPYKRRDLLGTFPCHILPYYLPLNLKMNNGSYKKLKSDHPSNYSLIFVLNRLNNISFQRMYCKK